MHAGVWDSLQTHIGPDSGKKFNTRIYMHQMYGGTRVQEAKVIRVQCKDAG